MLCSTRLDRTEDQTGPDRTGPNISDGDIVMVMEETTQITKNKEFDKPSRGAQLGLQEKHSYFINSSSSFPTPKPITFIGPRSPSDSVVQARRLGLSMHKSDASAAAAAAQLGQWFPLQDSACDIAPSTLKL
ncbi:hypothetical protein Tco_1149650 [Tanacetum coccineum]